MKTGAIEFERRDHATHGEYLAHLSEGRGTAKLTWTARDGTKDGTRGGVRVADHTETPPAARGSGVAAELVEALVRDARRLGFRIEPACPYVAHKFDEHPEWDDLRA